MAPRTVATALLLTVGLVAEPGPARAICDVIPQPEVTFRGETGALNRVYASPGDPVQVSIDPAGCEAGLPAPGGDPDVVLVFQPPQGDPSLVVLAGSGGGQCAALADDLDDCQGIFPSANLACLEEGATVSGNTVTFAFPDTEAVVGAPADGLPLSGPVTVAVTTGGLSDVCGLLGDTCAGVGPQPSLAACIDTLYASDGTCDTDAEQRHPQFPGLTALPQRNDFEAICGSADPSIPCNNTGEDIRLTTDAAGNLVAPVDWRGILVPGTLPIPRLVRINSSIAAFAGPPPEPAQTPGAPIQVPGLGFLQSFSPKGLRVDPLFNPLFSEDQATDTELFGSADADFGVVRILRRSPVFRECNGGARVGLPCTVGNECPGAACVATTCRGGPNDGVPCSNDQFCGLADGECGSSLFDFSDRYSDSATGPVVIGAASYDAEALNPAAIDGLAATDDLFLFVRSEPIEAKDLNQDGDELDDTIVSIRDAKTGQAHELGVGGSVGPASTRVNQFPFAFPAVAVEGDVIALLVSEPDEQIDENGDGDDWDAALQLFRLEDGGPVDLLGGGGGPAADGLPLIDRSSLTVSDGLVFFRESEPDGAGRVTVEIPNPNLRNAFPTPDGRFLAGLDEVDGVVPGDANSCDDAVVYDRDTDQDGIYDEMGATGWVIASVDSAGNQDVDEGPCFPCCPHNGAIQISDDGREVFFWSTFDELVAGDTNASSDIFVHDRDADGDGIYDEPGAIETRRLSLTTAGAEAVGSTVTNFEVAGGGRWLVFATTMVLQPSDLNGTTDVYVRDRDTDQDGIFDEPGAVATYRLTDALGIEPDDVTAGVVVTPDGRHVMIVSRATNLDGPERGTFVLDRDADEDGVFDEPGQVGLRRVSITTEGEVPAFYAAGPVAMTPDARRLLFTTSSGFSDAMGPGNGDDLDLVFHDRDADGNGIFDEPGGIETRRLLRSQVSRFAFPSLPNGGGRGALSPDGRVALFYIGEVAFVNQMVVQGATVDRIDLDTGIRSGLTSYVPTQGDAPEMALEGTNLVYLTATGPVIDGVDPAAAPNDVSGDGDQDDRVLVVADATQPAPISLTPFAPATKVAVAAGNAVFLRPESADATDLNGDLDTDDEVVHLYRNRTTLPPGVNLDLAAVEVATSAQYLAVLASEAGEGLLLNGDGDMDDLVVHVDALATADGGSWTNLFIAADAVQVVNEWVAFTVPEADQGQVLNADGDQLDRVLRVYDAATASYLAFQDPQSVPIPGLAVDDFVLGEQVVAFRVNEFSQGADLNGDGDLLDSVLHVADLATGTVYNSTQAAIPCPVEACDPRIPYRVVGTKVTFLTLEAEQGGTDLDQNGDGGTGLVLQHFNPDALVAGGAMGDACDVLAGALAGLCTSSQEACAQDTDCPGTETCYFPPGGCLFDTGVSCSSDADCGGSEFCAPVIGMPGVSRCHVNNGPCLDDGDCNVGEVCFDDGRNAEELFSAFGKDSDGRQRFVHRGVCSDGDGACDEDADCNDGATCNLDAVSTTTAADPDADGLADPIDNCPDVANGDQRDTDQDGIGDACDRQTCGNGRQEYGETCDHGDQNGIDGFCSAACVYVGGGGFPCFDGLDNDGDGLVDAAGDPGCVDGFDLSERETSLPCDDGRDNDGDYGVDVFGDAGCLAADSAREDPQCSDGLDNDGDGQVDWDGAGYATPDAYCAGLPYRVREKKKSGCGLGPELLVLLPLLGRARRVRGPRPKGL